MAKQSEIIVPNDVDKRARRYYRQGYRDGLMGFAVYVPTRLYADAYCRGYDDGFDASDKIEVRAFEKEETQCQ